MHSDAGRAMAGHGSMPPPSPKWGAAVVVRGGGWVGASGKGDKQRGEVPGSPLWVMEHADLKPRHDEQHILEGREVGKPLIGPSPHADCVVAGHFLQPRTAGSGWLRPTSPGCLD